MHRLTVERPGEPTITNVRIVDQRPKWERKYYLGGGDDRVMRNSITFIPVERIDPYPWDLFRSELEKRFNFCGEQPTSLVVRIQSCGVVVNENLTGEQRADLRAAEEAREAQREEEEKEQRRRDREFNAALGRPNEDDDDSSVSGDLAGNLIWALLKGCYHVGSEGVRYTGHLVHLRPGHAGPPMRLDTAEYPQGTTFDLAGEVDITLASGQQRTVTVRKKHTVWNPKGAAIDSVNQAVKAGIDLAADRVVRESLGMPLVDPANPATSTPSTGDSPILPLILNTTPETNIEPSTTPVAPAKPHDQAALDETRRLEQAEVERNRAISESLRR